MRTKVIFALLSILFIASTNAQVNPDWATNSHPAWVTNAQVTIEHIDVTNAQSALAALIHFLCPNVSYTAVSVGLLYVLMQVRARWAKGNTGLSWLIAHLAADPPQTTQKSPQPAQAQAAPAPAKVPTPGPRPNL